MTQTDIRRTTSIAIMRSADFKAGVEDVRTGRPACFDDHRRGWNYEWGRHWATIAPTSLPLRLDGRINRRAVALFDDAFDRGDITP
jgi:hypothetical protein